MNVVKQEQHEQELAVFAARHDMRAMHAWLQGRRDELNARWFSLEGNELLKAQGEAKFIARQIKLIEQGPAITKTERAP
jgi:hypothetical protein